MPFPPLKVFRVFRLVRVVRLLRANGTTRILRSLVKDRAGSALALLLLMGILVLEFGSLYVLHIEEHAPVVRTSPRDPTPCGTSSSRSPRSAMATSIR